MLIGVLSDTHGSIAVTQAALAVFEQRHVEKLIHCGDLDTVEILSLFSGWTTHLVFGNMDVDHDAIRHAADMIGAQCHDDFGAVQWGGREIAFLHGHQRRVLRQTIASGRWDLVLHGHSHEPQVRRVGSTLVVNPGALYRASMHTVALIDLSRLDVEHVTI